MIFEIWLDRLRRARAVLVAAGVAASAACSQAPAADGDDRSVAGAVGAACLSDSACRPGEVCSPAQVCVSPASCGTSSAIGDGILQGSWTIDGIDTAADVAAV